MVAWKQATEVAKRSRENNTSAMLLYANILGRRAMQG